MHISTVKRNFVTECYLSMWFDFWHYFLKTQSIVGNCSAFDCFNLQISIKIYSEKLGGESLKFVQSIVDSIVYIQDTIISCRYSSWTLLCVI